MERGPGAAARSRLPDRGEGPLEVGAERSGVGVAVGRILLQAAGEDGAGVPIDRRRHRVRLAEDDGVEEQR